MSLQQVRPEPEANYVAEANLHSDIRCEKNPGHQNFIPVNEFGLQHLPRPFKQPWRVLLVKNNAELVVRVKASVVSPARPSVYPGTQHDYPFYKPEGGIWVRTGTGLVRNVVKRGDEGHAWYKSRHKTCQCVEKDCGATKWWLVSIITSKHVVFDEMEVRDSEVLFFFDSGSEHDVNVCKAKGLKVVNTNMKGDRCLFQVALHDKVIGERLEKALVYVEQQPKHKVWNVGQSLKTRDPVIIVSHPHGASKHVTVGRLYEEKEDTKDEDDKKEEEKNNNNEEEKEKHGKKKKDGVACRGSKSWFYEPIKYTADTCPGSSGGLVLLGACGQARDPLTREVRQWPMWGYPHSHALPDGINESGTMWWY